MCRKKTKEVCRADKNGNHFSLEFGLMINGVWCPTDWACFRGRREVYDRAVRYRQDYVIWFNN